MEKKLPLHIEYDLQGYRGFGLTEFDLGFKELTNEFVGYYSNDKAEYALYVEFGKTKEEVSNMLYNDLVKDKYIK